MRIPNASFPGVIVTISGEAELADVLEREQALSDAGGSVDLPGTDLAEPSSLRGEGSTRPCEYLRTTPRRVFGRNLDVRYLREGVTVYLPCHIDGCGLAADDFHYAQGNDEVSGTAIEMDFTSPSRQKSSSMRRR